MRKWLQPLVILAMLVIVYMAVSYFLSGIPSAVANTLREAESFELLSLDPTHGRQDADFHGYKVLGRMAIPEPAPRQQLYDALESGARWHLLTAKCFDPRHAIRVVSRGRTYDLLICFECLQVQVYAGEILETTFKVNQSPESTFDQVLRDAGVPLAPKAQSE